MKTSCFSILRYRKGTRIPDYGAPNLRIQDNGQTLIVMSAQLLDFGEYSCEATNEAGTSQKSFELTVQGKDISVFLSVNVSFDYSSCF